MSRKRLFDIIQIGNKNDLPSRLFDYFITTIILINLVVTFVLTFTLSEASLLWLQWVERITMILFTVEYILRLWTADYLYPGKSRGRATLRFVISFYCDNIRIFRCIAGADDHVLASARKHGTGT